jgi:phage/plasmid-associated DNA primase
MAATSEQRTTMDPLGGFFAEYCVINPKCQVQATDLYQEYLKWSDATRERAMSQRWFGLRLAERGSFIKEQHRDGFYWIGIGLKSSFDESSMPENMQNVNLVNLVNLKKDSIIREKKENDISLFNTSTENRNLGSQESQESRHEENNDSSTPWWIELGYDDEPEAF